VTDHRRRILTALRQGGPMLDDELLRVFPGSPGSTIRAARLALLRSGLVRESGRRRRTRYGKPATEHEAMRCS